MSLHQLAPSIWIAAAVIEDGEGRLFLVRKRGTDAFMQAGGKIEAAETPLQALCRELEEELGCTVDNATPKYLGTFVAEAANEPGHLVKAELFHVRMSGPFAPAAEIVEGIWLYPAEARALCLAPLTRGCVLPLLERL